MGGTPADATVAMQMAATTPAMDSSGSTGPISAESCTSSGKAGVWDGKAGIDAASTGCHDIDVSQVLPAGTPMRGGKVINRDDWLIMKGEGVLSYCKRLCFEGHTVPDAFMTAACAQIGQIMLNSPSALYRAGLVSGSISMLGFLLCGFWTIYVLMALYLQCKYNKIKDGSWFDTDGQHKRVVQYFEVMDHHLGPWAKWSSLTVAVIALFGVCMTQITACSNDMYFINNSRSKREWSLIFGGVMVFTMISLPRFNHFRLLNVIGLVGTGYTAIYLIVDAAYFGSDFANINKWAKSPQLWFTGCAVLLSELGGHNMVYETMEAMEAPQHFRGAFQGAWIWTVFVVIPQSIIVNISYPKYLGMGIADNVFALQPVTAAKRASVVLMIIHQFIAFALYTSPLCFIWEKLLRCHTKPFWVRFLARIPIAGFIWFLALIAPFYGPINALYASLATPYLGFILPCIAILWIYRTKERRDMAIMKPYGLFQNYGYAGWWVTNIFMIMFFAGFGGASIYYSALGVKQAYGTWGAFAECYACPPTPAPRPAPAVNVTNITATNASMLLLNATVNSLLNSSSG